MDEDHGPRHGVEKQLRDIKQHGEKCPTSENIYIYNVSVHHVLQCDNVDESAHPTESEKNEIAASIWNKIEVRYVMR